MEHVNLGSAGGHRRVDSRERFASKAHAEPIPEVTSPEWLDRCGFAPGLDIKGELFPMKFQSQVRCKSKRRSFRSSTINSVYVRCAALIEDVMPEVAKAGDTGLVLYGYIDEEAGVSFQPLWIAKEGESTPTCDLIPEETMYLIRLANLDDCEFCSMKWIEVDPYIVDRAKTRHCGKSMTQRAKKRRDTLLPRTRPIPPPREHPDDFGVAVYYEDKTKGTRTLVGPHLRVEGNQCFGTLLMDSKHPDGTKRRR